ncbi:MAG: hypothetical protein WC702_04765 [Patescibacteria group bacterium]
MLTSLASLVALVPEVFTNLGITFDPETNAPLLVVKIVKRDGVLTLTTEPEFDTKGMTEKLDPTSFEEGVVYELQFGPKEMGIYSVDGVVTNSSINPGLQELGVHLYYHGCCAAGDLDKTLRCLPSVENLTESLGVSVERYLMKALNENDTDAFVTGPIGNWAIFEKEAVDGDMEAITIPIPLERENMFYSLAVTILVAVFEALFPDIVRAQQMAIIDRTERILVAARKKLCPHPPDDTPYRVR